MRLHCSFTVARCLISSIILTHFVRRGTAGAQPFSAGARAPAGPGLAPPLSRQAKINKMQQDCITNINCHNN